MFDYSWEVFLSKGRRLPAIVRFRETQVQSFIYLCFE